jgi:hypothetical protein
MPKPPKSFSYALRVLIVKQTSWVWKILGLPAN